MEYIEVKLPKCTVYLSHAEIGKLLQKDTELFATALKRSKGIIRHGQQKTREKAKWEREQGFH